MTNKFGGFEEYSRPIERFIDKISITKIGRIGFNKSVDAKYNLQQYERAVLYLNKAEDEVGIEFIKGTVESNTLKLLRDKRGYGVHLNAGHFFKTYGINLDKAYGLYEYRKAPVKNYGIKRNGDMFIIKLTYKNSTFSMLASSGA